MGGGQTRKRSDGYGGQLDEIIDSSCSKSDEANSVLENIRKGIRNKASSIVTCMYRSMQKL